MGSFDTSRIHPVEAMRNDIDRLTIFRELTQEPPIQTLVGLLDELLADDWQSYNVLWAYHELASAVLNTAAPVVLGDRWRDYILFSILQRDNAFSVSAAAGCDDDILLTAMRGDMQILQQIFLLDDSMIRHWCKELLRTSPDGVTEKQWVGWSGGHATPDYGSGPLAQMRAHLNLSEDWRHLPEVMRDYFRKHGSGSFIASRRLVWDGSALILDMAAPTNLHNFPVLLRQKEEMLAALKTPGGHILLEGPCGSGKTLLLQGLTAEMDNLAVVMCDGDAPNLSKLWVMLATQPLKFAICLLHPQKRVNALSFQSRPQNVTIVEVVDTDAGDSACHTSCADTRIAFGRLTEADFSAMVQDALNARGVQMPPEQLNERVLAAASDLSLRGAQRLAERIASQQQ